jgi:LacI family transcriptional regulator
MVTIYDIAKKANVSAMTVSKVINNAGRISEKTRKKVRLVMEELNYVPNQMARSLVLQQSNILFLLITDITNPFYTTLARGAEDAAKKHGYRLLFGNSDENLIKEGEYIETILGTRVDGVLFSPAGDRSLPNLETLRMHKVPFVLLDREVPGVECDVVLGDSKEGARQLVEHMIDHKHQRIALINGSLEISSARLRQQGYIEAHKLNKLPIGEDHMLELSYSAHSDLTTIENWLKGLTPLPTAIVAGNNVLAVEAIRAIQNCGLQVPEDISVACFDDLGAISEITPFLTVVAQQAYQFGFIGVQLLIERIMERETAKPWKKIILPVELIPRKSVTSPHLD